ncbi:MAG: hypothetical protein Ct9H300mP16_13770 [Pseudomonadota bacterium]|nr:MAG: hypothetical protein Ct9H300mP16_13770 [Pseudomonadota bacterium]
MWAMSEEVSGVVAAAADDEELLEHRQVELRYLGQGHELAIPLPAHHWTRQPDRPAALRGPFINGSTA